MANFMLRRAATGVKKRGCKTFVALVFFLFEAVGLKHIISGKDGRDSRAACAERTKNENY